MDALKQLNRHFDKEMAKLDNEVKENILHHLYVLGKETIERENNMLF